MHRSPKTIEGGPALRARLAKTEDAHKYDHGHVLVLAGGPGRGGAARLAARAALRVGAGLVTVGCPHGALAENAARLDAIMLREVGDAGALARILDDPRITAVCLGPGLGVGPGSRALAETVLASGRAAVLDADALTTFEDDPPALHDSLHDGAVLTPHAGEFRRVFPRIDPGADREDAARRAAGVCGATVLLKGARTLVAAPDGALAVSDATGPAAAPWLATAGAGDVLAGLVAGLLARGLAPFEAASAAAWLHAECARGLGPGLIAEDLPEALPRVFRRLGL